MIYVYLTPVWRLLPRNEGRNSSTWTVTVRICRSVYHRIGHLFPDVGQRPKLSQIYIFDTDNELANRLAWNSELNKQILLNLQNMLHQSNPYVTCFQHAADVFSRSNESENLKLVLNQYTNKDLRRYNLPTALEIAVVIQSNSTNSPTNRDIVLFKRSSTNPDAHGITHIKETDL